MNIGSITGRFFKYNDYNNLKELIGCPNLKSINLKNCRGQFFYILFEFFFCETSPFKNILESINLDGTHISDNRFAGLRYFKNLKKISLRNCHFLTYKSLQIIDISNMKEINISHTLLSDASLLRFKDNSVLKKIEMKNCPYISQSNKEYFQNRISLIV